MNFGFTLKNFKGMFFDRALVEGKIDRQTHAVMIKLGAFIRQSARRNFRRKTAKHPVPPNPRNLTDKLRGAILFGWESIKRSLVVGPWLFPATKDKENPPPKKVERGGTYTMRRRGKTYSATYREFPFMRNALAKELPKLPMLWRTTIPR